MAIECVNPDRAVGTPCPEDCVIRQLAETRQRGRAKDDKLSGGIWGESNTGSPSPSTEGGQDAERKTRARSLPGYSEREVQGAMPGIYQRRKGVGCAQNPQKPR